MKYILLLNNYIIIKYIVIYYIEFIYNAPPASLPPFTVISSVPTFSSRLARVGMLSL